MGLWREGFKEKVSFEFRVEKSRSDGQWQWWWWDMSLDISVEKSEKKNDQDYVDGMRQEVYSKGKEMHNEMSGQWFFKRNMMMVERGNRRRRTSFNMRWLNRDQISEVARLNFVCKRKNFILKYLLTGNYWHAVTSDAEKYLSSIHVSWPTCCENV